MQAAVCREFGLPEALAIQELPTPRPEAGEVLVKIAAAGVNYADLLMVAGKYQVKPSLPFIPGLEFSGVVAEAGHHTRHLRVGDRVMGAPAMGGCFAQYICMPEEKLFLVPPEQELALDKAAGLLIAYGTAAYSVINRARLGAGESILVTGAGGGVGLATVEIAKRIGARVIASASSSEKLAAASAHGADAVVNYLSSDLRESVASLTNGRGVDVVIDMVGGAIFEAALRSTARMGRIVLVGFASGDIPRIRGEYLLIKNLAVLGSGFGASLTGEMTTARETIAGVLNLNRQKPLRLEIAQRLGLPSVGTALQQLSNRRVNGKLLVVP